MLFLLGNTRIVALVFLVFVLDPIELAAAAAATAVEQPARRSTRMGWK